MLLCMELSTEELTFLLGEVRRVLKTGGLVLYSVRNTFDKHFGAGVHKSEEMYDIGGFVVHFFSEEKVRSLSSGYEVREIRRIQEGNVPRELYAVALKKTDLDAHPENAKKGGNMADSMGKVEEFFHDVYHTGVLDGKTKHLVALAASLAAGCES